MKLRTYLCATICSLICCVSGSAQNLSWKLTNGPYGGNVYSLASSGTAIVAGTSEGAFRSNDSGATWSLSGLANGTVWALTFNGSTLFAGTDAGAYSSLDNGQTWKAVTGLPDTTDVYALLISGAFMLAGTDQGIYRSTDNGVNWTSSGISDNLIYSFGSSGSTLYAGTSGAGIYHSTNNGATWSVSGVPNATIYNFLLNGSTLYAGSDGGILRLGTGGGAWQSVALQSQYVYSLTLIGSTLSAGTDNGIYHSSNGTSWTQASLSGIAIQAFGSLGTLSFAGASGEGVYRSSNDGSQYSATNNGLDALAIYQTTIINSSLTAATESGVFSTTDNGATWTNSGLNEITISAVANIGTTNFAATFGNFVYRKQNGGAWTQLTNTGSSDNNIYCLGVTPIGIFAGGDSGIYYSSDNGNTWLSLLTSLSPIYGFATTDSIIYAASGDGIYVSNDFGFFWENFAYPGSPYSYSVATIGSTIYAGSDYGVFNSTDGGITWSQLNTLSNPVYGLQTVGKLIAAGTYGSGVYLSQDKGATWTQENTGLFDPFISSFAIAGSTMFAASENGVFASVLPASVNAPLITALRSIDVCEGNDTLLRVSVSGGKSPYTFVWKQTDGSAIPAADIISGGSTSDSTIRIKPSASRSLSVIVTDANALKDSIEIDVALGSMPVPAITQQGNTLVCNITGAQYQWYDASGKPVSGATSSSFSPPSSGSFSVTVSLGGCSGSSAVYQFTLDGVVTAAPSFEWSVMPNPARSEITVQFPSSQSNISVLIFDMLGANVTGTAKITSSSENDLTFDVHSLPNGTYILRLQSGNLVQSRTIIVSH